MQPAPVTVDMSPAAEQSAGPDAGPPGSADPGSGKAGSGKAEPSHGTSGAVSWEAMSAEQRMAYMKGTVSPRMKGLFQAQDAAEFAGMGCETCHGKGADLGSFRMPNPDLPVLDPANQFAAARKHHAKMLEFMMSEVTPQMAGLLGMPTYNPTTKQGFGCFDCHTMAK